MIARATARLALSARGQSGCLRRAMQPSWLRVSETKRRFRRFADSKQRSNALLACGQERIHDRLQKQFGSDSSASHVFNHRPIVGIYRTRANDVFQVLSIAQNT